ncbi:MAG: hypothetical protein DMG63_06525 [Acidobacteria bacterium]|nr:MAG: hypothetical protein DMG63_06525 [Acidobacteriota bacterium]
MSSSDSWNLLVFRDGRRVLNGPELLGTLRENLNALYSISDFSLLSTRERLTEALLRSGELECSLADHEGCHRAADILARTTDQLAIALSGQLKLPSPILDNINALDVPELLAVPIPEGFCYYALHPLDYIDLLNENPLSAPAAAVVGIRSIGATLSAVVRAWFELRGIPADRITVRPSGHPFDRTLMLSDRDLQWITNRHIPTDAADDIGWGAWRSMVFANEHQWPGVWSWTERRKFLSADRRNILRFDGYGHYGSAVRRRTHILAEHGWGAHPHPAADGFSRCTWIAGERRTQADRDIVLQLARYCAFRAAHFETTNASTNALEEMTQINLARALNVSHSVFLPIERPVIADARMMPHEWIATDRGRLFKVDAATHGDDHFYPGATDIAWDLAGAIVEWKLDEEASDLLIGEYERISGDSIQTRLPGYLVAYCAFRLGFILSAGRSVSDAKESARFRCEANQYRGKLGSLLPLATAAKNLTHPELRAAAL